MSANISIKEGGTPFPFGPVKALLVEGENGEYHPWVLESERQLGYKSIDQNGIFRASDDGVYGWGSVSVNVPTDQGVTGRDPDTGQEVTVKPDPVTGELEETVLPVEIRVTTPPDRTSYIHGEAIDYSGIVVHAYSATGQDMGEVPFNELVFPVSTADAGDGDEWTNGEGVIARRLSYTPHWNKYWDPIHHRPDPSKDYQVFLSQVIGERTGMPAMWGTSGGPTQFYVTVYGDDFYIWGATANRKLDGYKDTGKEYDQYDRWLGTSATCGSGELVVTSKESWITGIPESTADPSKADLSTLHAVQTLPVQWSRTGDGAVLETSFGIEVTTAGGGN